MFRAVQATPRPSRCLETAEANGRQFIPGRPLGPLGLIRPRKGYSDTSPLCSRTQHNRQGSDPQSWASRFTWIRWFVGHPRVATDNEGSGVSVFAPAVLTKTLEKAETMLALN